MIIQNNKREAVIRIEVIRQEQLNKIEKALLQLLGEMLSAVMTEKDDEIVRLFGNGSAQVADALNMAMGVRDQMGFQKSHEPAQEVKPPEPEQDPEPKQEEKE